MGHPQLQHVPEPPHELLVQVAAAFSDVAKLSLFGFDLIHEAETGLYAVIDINFFPGFDGVPDFTERFLKLIHKKSNPTNLL